MSSASGQALTHPRFDVAAVRRDFPILDQEVQGHPLVYLDSAASAQKPRTVIDAISRFYSTDYANIHRGVHTLSERATNAFEGARVKVQRFLGADDPREIVFVRNATEAINLVARTFGKVRVGAGDEVLITGMEHHANLIPWQMLCEETGARLVVAPVTSSGELDLVGFRRRVTPRTRMISVVHMSNSLGTINPVRDIVRLARSKGIPVLLDGAQAVVHFPVDVRELGCDFYVFSGHKLFGPSGIGVLYGRGALLDSMPPFLGGGDMIQSVTYERATYKLSPGRFEAGTPAIEAAVGLGAAIDYLGTIDRAGAARHEHELLDAATTAVSRLEGVRVIGTAREKASVLSFVVEGIHAHDLGTILDAEGVAVRVGHHCTQPLMARLGVPATARASFAFYNTHEEIGALVRGLQRAIEVFHRWRS